MKYIKTYEDLHQKNAPAIDGVNSSKPRKQGTYYQYGQNTDDNDFVDTSGVADGADGGGGVPMAGDNTRPNVAPGAGNRAGNDRSGGGNSTVMGAMASTEMTKPPTEEEEDHIRVPLLNYTKKGVTGDNYTKIGYVQPFGTNFTTNDSKRNIILKYTEFNG